jgi:DinB superfamily
MTTDVDAAVAENRRAVHELAEAAERTGATWAAPRAPGKWSPSQIVEHVALALEASANEITGKPSGFPTLPAFIRPVARTFFFKRVLRTEAFPKAKTNKAMDPASGPATLTDARPRLEAALRRFDEACRSCAANDGIVGSRIFGRVTLADYARFTALHTLHHRRQIPS